MKRASPSKSDKKPYTGILAQPMPKWTMLTGPTDEELAALIDEKFRALFAHYEIEPAGAMEGGPETAPSWANIAFHLARDHVPGFRGAPRRRGKPAMRKDDDVILALHVELLKRRDGLSIRKAIKEIAGQNIVQGTWQTLEQRYKRAKANFVMLSRLFDNIAAAKGNDVLVHAMEEGLSGDSKDTFLSPD